jgi:hypothetical protein
MNFKGSLEKRRQVIDLQGILQDMNFRFLHKFSHIFGAAPVFRVARCASGSG